MEENVEFQCRVEPERLYRYVEPSSLGFDTTRELLPLKESIGQPRAVDAIKMGAQIRSTGFNLYVAGRAGSLRERTVHDLIVQHAKTKPNPGDWVYVYNFMDADHPIAIRLDPGLGRRFSEDMDDFILYARKEIPKAFETENYERKRKASLSEVHHRRHKLIEDLATFARSRDVSVELTPSGFLSVPLLHDKPIPRESYDHLPEELKQEIERNTKEVQSRANAVLREFRDLDKEEQEKLREVAREIARFALGVLMDELHNKYHDFPEVLSYLEQTEEDLLDHLSLFTSASSDKIDLSDLLSSEDQKLTPHDPFIRYRVNVFVDHSQTQGAPVIFEKNPTYYNLLGKISYRPTLGAMITDFLQIESGAFHRANGGFLVVDAIDVLRSPFAWDVLKRVLLSRKIQIENLGEQFAAYPASTLRPQAIPADLKVVLIGSPFVYQLLMNLDPEFQRLFKIKADFSPEMDFNDESIKGYALFVSRCVHEQSLKHFDCGAVARLIENGARLMANQRKLSARLMEIADLAAEASFWAEEAGHDLVTQTDVEKAIEKKVFRSNLVETRLQEWIADGTLLIDVDGAKIGQINGISVHDSGDYSFGRPTRITASVGLGRGSVRSIEREIKLSGPIHSKGFLILSGYLREKYIHEFPLALGATITFEQSYDEVEGDSASLTELCSLLSALSDTPILQGIAVTGSVNQHGVVQAVGGINEKIEGFFSACRMKGLTGRQGVIIPRANLTHLMLKKDVRESIFQRQFHLWAVESVDEAITLLTKIPAGKAGVDGRYTKGSVHQRVKERLEDLAKRLRHFISKEGVPEVSAPEARRAAS